MDWASLPRGAGGALVYVVGLGRAAAGVFFMYMYMFYDTCAVCRTLLKVWTQLFAPSRDTPRAPCLLRTDKILLGSVNV